MNIPTERCKRHNRPLVYRPPGTPEQEFCGDVFVCDGNDGTHRCGYSILIPSEALKRQWAEMRTTQPMLPFPVTKGAKRAKRR